MGLPGPKVSPALVVMVGLPGTGKSHLVREVARREEVTVIQSDAIRRGMFARPVYSPEEHGRVFSVAHRRAEEQLGKGHSVLFDATSIYEASRKSLYRIAERTGARVLVVRTVAPDEVVAGRLARRAAGANPADRSEAGWEIYEKMKGEFEEVRRPHLVVDTTMALDPAIDEIVRFIRGKT